MALSKKVTSYDLLNVLELNKWRTVAEICTRLGKDYSDLESLAEVRILIQQHTRKGHLEFGLDEIYTKSSVRLKREGVSARKAMPRPKRNDGALPFRKTG